MSFRYVALFAIVGLLPFGFGQDSEAPSDSDVVERVRSELGSISFVLTPTDSRKARRAREAEGDAALAELQRLARSIAAEDMYLKIGARDVQIDSVDPICDLLSEDVTEVTAAAEDSPIDEQVMAATKTRPILYTFYIDRFYLTMAGFQNALYQALELSREAVRPQDWVALVINSGRQEVTVKLTPDASRLERKLREIKADTRNPKYNIFPPEQTLFSRLEDIRWSANPELTALDWARYEDREVLRALERLEISLRAMEAPLQDVTFVDKVMFYFADLNQGRKAGQFFTDLADGRNRDPISQGAFDRVTKQANASGVKLYTIQPAGQGALTSSTQRIGSQVVDAGASLESVINYGRETLRTFAAETGGRAFVAAGANVDTIVGTLREDLRCRVYVNFRVSDKTPRNRLQAVDLEWKRREIPDAFDVRTQGQYVISDKDTREANRSMAQFVGFSESGGRASEEAVWFMVRPRRFVDDEVDLEIQHVVSLDRAIPEYLSSDEGLGYTGEAAQLRWAFEHFRKYRDERLGRQKPVVVSNLSSGKVVFLSYVREELDDPFGFYASGGVEATDFRRSEAIEAVGLPRVRKEKRRFKIETPEAPLSINFMQPVEAYLLTEKESGRGNKNVGVPHQLREVVSGPDDRMEVSVALVEPGRPLVIEYPVCRVRDRDEVGFRVTINGDVMQFEDPEALPASRKSSDKRTGLVDLGKQACRIQQDVVTADQLTDRATLNNGEIHRYEVGVFQGGSEIYTMSQYFKVQD